MIIRLPAWHAVSGAPGARQPAAGVAVNGTYHTSRLSAAASSRSTGLLRSRGHAVLHEALPRRNMYADVCAGRCPGAQQQHHQAPAALVGAAMPMKTRKQDRSRKPEHSTSGQRRRLCPRRRCSLLSCRTSVAEPDMCAAHNRGLCWAATLAVAGEAACPTDFEQSAKP